MFERTDKKISTIFLFLNQNICCGYSKEPSQCDPITDIECLIFEASRYEFVIEFLNQNICYGYLKESSLTQNMF